MHTSLDISAEQVQGDLYAAWLRDTHERNSTDAKRIYTSMIDKGFDGDNIVLRRQRLGINFVNSLVPLLHQSALTKLDLHGNVLRDAGCELLVHVLHDLPCLTYLDLGANAIGCSFPTSGGSGGIGAGGREGMSRSSIRQDSLSNTNGDGGGAGHIDSATSRATGRYLAAMHGLGRAVARHNALAVLLLGFTGSEPYPNQIDAAGASAVIEGCVLSRCLTTLDLSGNPFAFHEDIASPAQPVSGGVDPLARPISGAGLGGTDVGSPLSPMTAGGAASPASGGAGSARGPVRLLAQLLRTSTTLTHMRLRAVGLHDGAAAVLLGAVGASRSLQLLDMSGNDFSSVVADAAGALLQMRMTAARGNSPACTLQSLIFSENDLWDNKEAAAQARRSSFGFSAKSTRRSTTPAAAASGLGTRMQARLSPSVGTNLALSLPSTSSSPFVNCTRNLRYSNAGATTVVLPSSPPPPPPGLSSSSVADAAVFAATQVQQERQPGFLLLAAVGHDQHLTSLSLDECAMDDAALRVLCRALRSNATLKTLSLRKNTLTPNGIVLLGQTLCRNSSLKCLFLAGNTVEDMGACALASALDTRETALVELDVSKAWVGDRGIVAMGVALQSNISLQVLRIADNTFTHKGGTAFVALLENNTSVRRCEVGGTSMPHNVVLRMEKVTKRNRGQAATAAADALKKRVVRLHFQDFKLSEAQLELEALQEKNADVKRSLEAFDVQSKHEHGDLTKRIRSLEEQIENAKEQQVRYTEQSAKLESDLVRAQESHEEEMAFAAERLAVETNMREAAEAEFAQATAELEEWHANRESREAQKRAALAATREEIVNWSAQRREYRERAAELEKELQAMAGGGRRR